MTKWNEIASVETLKHYDDEKETETKEPASLQEKFDYLLDILGSKEQQFNDLEEEVKEFMKRWLNHRHSIAGGIYSGKGER